MVPSVSVVIPAFNCASHLKRCLAAIRASDLQPAECIVVDDGSTDESSEVAAQFGAKFLSTGGRFGPAKARNLGAQEARGDILVFLDADVVVHPDAISAIAREFSEDPELDAVMGSYDRQPTAAGYVSQYRNLMHCYVHQHGNTRASTFWAGCGAIRSNVFKEFGGFNEVYQSPSIEDIELGYRMARAGRKLMLNPDIQVTHLKTWGVRNMMKTDFFYRALPWAELSLRAGRLPNDLNLRISQRISVALVFLLAVPFVYLTIHSRAYFLTPLLATLFILLSQYWLQSSTVRSRKAIVAMVSLLVVIVVLSYWFKMYAIIPSVLSAWIALFARHRFAQGRTHRRTGVIVGAHLLVVTGFVWFYFPWHPVIFLAVFLLLVLLVLNQQFYMFLAGNKGKLFALAAIPFHMLYFAASGVAFIVAVFRSGAWRGLRRASEAPVQNAPEKVRAAVQ